MPFATADGVKLYYEVTGKGDPIVFVHEFAGDHRSWEPQVRHFSRRYRCVTYNARGYPPSDVPNRLGDYAQVEQADDIGRVMRRVGLKQAHVVGLSMGAFAALHFGLRHPAMARSLTVAGCGSGAVKATRKEFQEDALSAADAMVRNGMAKHAAAVAIGPTRIQLKNKDPRGWAEFSRHLTEHSAKGSAMTLRGYQARRPSLYDLEAALRRLKVPVLLAVGDEDEPCLEANLFLKRCISTAGLWIAPNTGHAINLEEPAAFNQALENFLAQVEQGRWPLRDPRSIGGSSLGVVRQKRR
jgi:pimeloyl-ACP methyl ester carboxylesterase